MWCDPLRRRAFQFDGGFKTRFATLWSVYRFCDSFYICVSDWGCFHYNILKSNMKTFMGVDIKNFKLCISLFFRCCMNTNARLSSYESSRSTFKGSKTSSFSSQTKKRLDRERFSCASRFSRNITCTAIVQSYFHYEQSSSSMIAVIESNVSTAIPSFDKCKRFCKLLPHV